MKKLLFTFALLAGICVNAQTWGYTSGDSDFDGKYKTSYVRGSGSEFPYNEPSLAINKFENSNSVNFYISGAGYFQEDTDVRILWVFDNEPGVIYSTYDFSYSTDGKILFLTEFNDPNSDNKISKYEFIKKLKLASKVSVRTSDDYGSNDLSFSLSGSAKAIDFVLPDMEDVISIVESERKIKNELKAVKKLELNKLLKTVQNEKLTTSSMSKLKSAIEDDLDDLGIGLEGTGKSYVSIKLLPHKGMFKSYGWVDAFYILEDGSEKKISGFYEVDMDSPLKAVIKLELNKLLETVQNEKLTTSSMSELKSAIEDDLDDLVGIGLLGSYVSIKLLPHKGMFKFYGWVDAFYILEDGSEKEISGFYKVDMDSPLFQKRKAFRRRKKQNQEVWQKKK